MRYFILACAVCIICSPCARAQSAGFGVQGDVMNFTVGNMANTFSVNSGSDYTNDLKSIYGLGYGGGVHLDLNLVLLSFRVSADYVTASPDQGKYQSLLAKYIGSAASAVSIDGGRVNIYSANANLKFILLPLPVVHVYVTGGVGLARLDVSEAKVKFNGSPVTTFPAVQSQTKSLFDIGAGVDLGLGGVTLYGELKFVFIFTDPKTSNEVPLATVGLTF